MGTAGSEMLEPSRVSPGQGQPDLPLAPNARGFKASQEAFERFIDPEGALETEDRRHRAAHALSDYLAQRRRGASIQQARYDTRDTTAAGRRAFDVRFELEVDPTGSLPPGERRRRADAARHASFQDLSRRGNARKRKKRAARRVRGSGKP